MIIFLVGFLSFNSNRYYISRKGLEHAVQDLIEDKDLKENEQQELLSMLRENPSSLIEPGNKYFNRMKYYLLPFILKR